jgi:O-antigen/teichoic acid export membrane protein
MQAVLSATSLLVGLILIRRISDLQYGYYVLMTNSILLLVTLQAAFIQPQLVVRMSQADAAGRAELVGGLLRDQRRLWPLIPGLTGAVALPLWFFGVLDASGLLVLLGATAAIIAALFRELFRMLLLSHRRPTDVLRADAVYVLLLISGAALAALSAAPAAAAGLAMALAASIGGLLCSRALWRFEPWNPFGAAGVLRSMTPLGAWSVVGSAVHWLVTYGYNFLVAGMLNVPSITAIAATRLTIMPVNLLSSGVGTMLLPTTALWLKTHTAAKVLVRLLRFALLLSAAAVCYFAVLWPMRNWLFTEVLKKQVQQRDTLLLLWFAVSLAMLWRDQIIYLLTVRHRFRLLTTVSIANALVSLAITYAAIRHLGLVGVVVGLLVVELLNVIGLLVMSWLEVRDRLHAS